MATDDAFSTTVLPADVVDDAGKSAIIAVLVVSVVMLCLLVSVMLFAYCRRRLRLMPEGWRGRICRLCRCLKVGGGGEEVAEMGYLPANITVNQGAVQQGVPDIFLRNSHSGRISIADPARCGDTDVISRDSSSAGETSGSWAEYLRRATLRASRAATGRRTAARAMTDSGMPVAASDAASSTDLTPMPVAASDAASSTDLTPKADPQ